MGGAMTISTTGSDIVIAHVHARALDASNYRDFKSAISPLLKPEAKLVFDLGEVAFVDSKGLEALASCLRHVRESNGEIKLCALNKSVRTLFELVRMHRVFEIFNNPAEAVSSYLT
jgi:anti-sigma B factor antagonist